MPRRHATPHRPSVKHRPRRKITKPKFNTLAKKRTRPRFVIRSSPSAAANVHMFKRSYDHPFTIGVADNTNGVYLNTDSKYMIVKLHTQFKKLPEYTEFKALFSEYKITSITHKLVPYFSQNQTIGGTAQPIPNYEVICLPVNSSARESDLPAKTSAQISDYINQAQRKAQRVMPSRTQRYITMNPKVVGYKGPIDKGAGTANMQMEAPGYLNTDPAALVTGGVDQTAVTHYGVTLLICRVDNAPLGPPPSGHYESMGFRMENEVFFKCRKVQ